MKTREFDINNYSTYSIIETEVKNAAEAYIDGFTHPFISVTNGKKPMYTSLYNVRIKPFTEMSAEDQTRIKELAFEQYETKKAKTIEEYTTLKAKCDHIFEDDKQYHKFLPEITNLYYCQAITALNDYMSKKLRSNAAANARYKARAMQYSTISCD